MKVTIKDIARLAGVSPSSVSLVLNERPCRISEEKKERIKRIAVEYHYSANQMARSLVTKQTKTVGLLMPDIENVFFSSLAKHIEMICRKQGYALMIVNTNNEYRNDLQLTDLLVSRSVDGLFIIPSDESYKDCREMIEKLKTVHTPFVMLDRVYDEIRCDKVQFDNEKGAFMAVQYLLDHGHRKIACITSSKASNNGRLRLKGYERAMATCQLDIQAKYILEGDYGVESGYMAADQLLSEDITAVFISNDMMMLGFLRNMHEKNKQIPDDYSIVSYDHSIYTYLVGPEITSVEQNTNELAEKACGLLFARLQNPDKPYEQLCLMPKLIEKSSVKRVESKVQA
ncbi:LacI family DNA-binding transcriptional regulator [Bacillus sp. 1P06AnD]|uniref:LacI family DNA-binding transcriptional regulator n=1 Tax=Bacillus sp. 1P06AnD TaxID=3132208 RepID=UPI0039A1351B